MELAVRRDVAGESHRPPRHTRAETQARHRVPLPREKPTPPNDLKTLIQNGSSQGHNLAWTALFLPNSLNSGIWAVDRSLDKSAKVVTHLCRPCLVRITDVPNYCILGGTWVPRS